ncbi:MAG TPA: hypothetical protein VN030_14445 [Cellvibrio sp.]|nr:hypothetical protein [Cellvibrio sp.]
MNIPTPPDILSALNKTSTNCPFAVILNLPQYTRYKAGYLSVQSPYGNHLETIGQCVQYDEENSHKLRMQNQIHAIENLLVKMTKGIELSSKTVEGLVDLLYEMQEFCGR